MGATLAALPQPKYRFCPRPQPGWQGPSSPGQLRGSPPPTSSGSLTKFGEESRELHIQKTKPTASQEREGREVEAHAHIRQSTRLSGALMAALGQPVVETAQRRCYGQNCQVLTGSPAGRGGQERMRRCSNPLAPCHCCVKHLRAEDRAGCGALWVAEQAGVPCVLTQKKEL